MNTDYLVLGSGIAGLSFALKVAEHFPNRKVTIITKGDENESNTKYAQGGIAIVTDKIYDSLEQHVEDTLKAGDGLCDEKVVKMVVEEGPDRLKELLNWGVEFDQQNRSDFDLGLEGGHSRKRILHRKDSTGLEIELKLLKQIKQRSNITILSNHIALELITDYHIRGSVEQKNNCHGAYVFNRDTRQIIAYKSMVTMLATGGIGAIYKNTTNPGIATGDGIAMAYRAKADISHMAYIQFHPTALYHPSIKPSFLISEAVRGFGAILRTKSGEAFMKKYDPRGELASRDIVSRAIDSEMKKSGDMHVYLDVTHLPSKDFKSKFPKISEQLRTIDIDISKDMIPVVPAAHYLCGGIEVNIEGETSINNLFACGECAHTGLHGANRLASNSLLEAAVFAHRTFEAIKEREKNNVIAPPEWNDKGTIEPNERILISHNRRELQSIMSDYVSIVRTDERLTRALDRLQVLAEETERLYRKSRLTTELIELRNSIHTALLVVKQSQHLKLNKGVFYKVLV